MGDILPIFYFMASLSSAVAAVLAWLAKLRWSQEFAAAKDETIKAKDAQIASQHAQFTATISAKEAQIVTLHDQLDVTLRAKDAELSALRELTPAKVRDAYLNMKEMLEEYNAKLEQQLEQRESEIVKLGVEISALQTNAGIDKALISELKIALDTLRKSRAGLQDQISATKRQRNRIRSATRTIEHLKLLFYNYTLFPDFSDGIVARGTFIDDFERLVDVDLTQEQLDAAIRAIHN